MFWKWHKLFRIKLEDAKELKNIFKTNLNEISKGRFKSEEQESLLGNIKLLFESRQTVIKLFNKYSSIVSEAKYKTKYAEGLKILTPKQMLQILPIALAQVKSSKISENLLNEIGHIIYSLYWAKEIAKKIYNNVTNSIKV